MRILFLSRWFPFPANNGSKIRVLNVLKQLAQLNEVVLLTFAEATDSVDEDKVAALREYCSSVRVFPYQHFRPASAAATLGYISSMPRYLVDTYSMEMAAAIAAEVSWQRFDLLVVSQLAMMPYAVEVKGVPAILEELEVAGFHDAAGLEQPSARKWRALLTWWKLRRYLRRALPRFAACTVVSEVERKHLQALAPNYTGVAVVPNALDYGLYSDDYGPPQPSSMIYAGAVTYSANYDAVRRFLGDIYPSLAAAVPELLFRVTGDSTGIDLGALSGHPGVQFTGYVADIRPVVARSWLSVVPLRQGGGTRLKILESMALGTPVVSTAKGAEGLDVIDGRDILLAGDDEAFVTKTCQLLRSPEARLRLARAARQLVAAKYDWRLVGRQLEALAQQAAAEGPGSHPQGDSGASGPTLARRYGGR
ncbi:MAG: glycosyltransferase family 4 protein [Chloroflexota bacterium]